MKELIISCKVFQDELKIAMDEMGISIPIVWMPQELHLFPERLREEIQEKLNKVPEECERIFLCFGVCGNSIVGLKTGNFELIIPRAEDCITLLLGSPEKRKELSIEETTFYLTRGWMAGEQGIMREYFWTLEKYGEEITREVYAEIMGEYKRLVLIDTGAYEVEEIRKEAEKMGTLFGMKTEVVKGSLDGIKRLFSSPFNAQYCVRIPKNSKISIEEIDVI